MRAVDDLALTNLCLACSLSLLIEVLNVSATSLQSNEKNGQSLEINLVLIRY